MRVIITTGLFPPDIGGPATHASDLADELRSRGHDVTVLTLGTARRTVRGPGFVSYPRSRPWPVRSAQGVAWLVRNRRRYDVVYATGLPQVAVPGSRLARRPVVLKIVGDVAWERGRLGGHTTDDFGVFQDSRPSSVRLGAMRWARNWFARHATAVVTPGENLGRAIRAWAPDRDVLVVPNGVRLRAPSDDAPATDRPHGSLHLVFAGRLVPVKRLEVLVRAVAQVEGVELEIVGEGPEGAKLAALVHDLGATDRVRFTGPLDHDATLARLAAADALVMASAHEGLPHVAIEALASGTPIVSAAVDGLLEVVSDGVNGVVVDPMEAGMLAAELSRLRDDAGLRRRLGEGAAWSGRRWRFDVCADTLEGLFASLTRTRPRVVFVGKTRIDDPPSPQVPVKFQLHARHLDQVTICTGPAGTRTIAGVRTICFPDARPRVLSSAAFYALAPLLAVAATLGHRRRSAIVCQSSYEAFGVLMVLKAVPRRMRPPVQVEVHGDWRAGPRLYGSPARRLLGPLSDRLSRWALRRASQVRAISDFTETLARQAGYRGSVERYPTFSDYEGFLSTPPAPLPSRPQALFVGALERTKAVDVLLEAWALTHGNVPGARLVVVGSGSMADWVERRVEKVDMEGTAERRGPMPQAALAALLDASTCLVVPSRSEGMSRVALEALARGRPVVATATGGIGEAIRDGVTGRLVAPEDAPSLSAALVKLLADRDQAAAMGRAGRLWLEERRPGEEYAEGIRRLAVWAAGAPTAAPAQGLGSP